MEAPTKSKRTPIDPYAGSFDVVCVLGTVEYGSNGTEPPAVAAMRLICDHDAIGTYSFPNEYGGQTVVTVEGPSDLRSAIENDLGV